MGRSTKNRQVCIRSEHTLYAARAISNRLDRPLRWATVRSPAHEHGKQDFRPSACPPGSWSDAPTVKTSRVRDHHRFVVSSFRRARDSSSHVGASLHDSGGRAEGQKAHLPLSCAGLRSVAHLNGRATTRLLARAAEEHVPRTNKRFRSRAERPNKNSLPGVAVLRNHFSSYQSVLVKCTNIPG